MSPQLTQGATGSQLAANLTRLRIARRSNYAELSRATKAAGNYIPVIGLRRIEDGERRVTVDDLLTLAQVYDVTLGELLLPPDDDPVLVTGQDTAMPRSEVARRLGLVDDGDVISRAHADEERWLQVYEMKNGSRVSREEALRDFAVLVAEQLRDSGQL